MNHSNVCQMFGIEIPVFGFSHCRNVVAEITRAGGMGCLGTAYYTPVSWRSS